VLKRVLTEEVNVVFDVGANVGNYIKTIQSIAGNSIIYAFEPHPKNFKKLVSSIDSKKVNSYNQALGDTIGTLSLFDYADRDGSSHASLHKEVIEGIHQKKSIEYRVDVDTVDSFVTNNKIEKINLLKIDTEGNEYNVLLGAKKTLDGNKIDFIQFEFSELQIVQRHFLKDFIDLLANFNFYRVLTHGLVELKPYDPVHHEIFAFQNILAVKKTIDF